MSFQTIGVGSSANDGTGDPLRTALQKVNANFALTIPPPAVIRPTSAQLKNLDSAPMLVVAAPGVGLAILPISVAAIYLYGTAPYTNVGSPDIYYGAAADGPNCGGTLGGVFDRSQSYFGQFPVSVGRDPLTTIENTALYFADQQAWVGGDGMGVITLFYALIPLT